MEEKEYPVEVRDLINREKRYAREIVKIGHCKGNETDSELYSVISRFGFLFWISTVLYIHGSFCSEDSVLIDHETINVLNEELKKERQKEGQN